jgi:hypothetical protein
METAICEGLCHLIESKPSTTAVDVIVRSMELVEHMRLPGSRKRDVVVQSVASLIRHLEKNSEHAPVPTVVFGHLKHLVDSGLVTNIIDVVVDATKNRIDVNKAIPITSRLCCWGGLATLS